MPRPSPAPPAVRPLHVSILALPESMLSPVGGIHEVLAALHHFSVFDATLPHEPRFLPEIVALERDQPSLASEVALRAQKTIAEIKRTDIVIVPSMILVEGGWVSGRYAPVVNWLRRMHAAGAELCSTCSGIFLLAETGLWREREATVHWAFAAEFVRAHPDVEMRLRDALVIAGERGELISSGASTAWYDLVLFLVARHVSPAAAQSLARFLLVQWHADGQAPYVGFSPSRRHGDAHVGELQRWIEDNYAAPAAVEALVKQSGLPERTLKRRFGKATGLAPIAYIQRLRVEEAKRRLEQTDLAIDEISWAVGYEEPAFFRRLFKRHTALTPGEYRRRFRLPDFARPGQQGTAGGRRLPVKAG